MALHGMIFPNDLLERGKCAFCSMTFLTMTITIHRDYGTFLGEVFYNNSGAFTECFMGHF